MEADPGNIPKKKYNENVRADEWATRISKAYIDFSVQMWKIRCQIVHANSVGTSDHAFRLLSMEILKKLKKTPWQLQFQDRHLIQRSTKFVDKAPIATVKMWRKRLQTSMIDKDERKKVVGRDMNFVVKKRERQEKSRIYSFPCKRKRRNQQSEQLNSGSVKQVLPIKKKMIARAYHHWQMHVIKEHKKMDVTPPVQLTSLDPSFTRITNNRMHQTRKRRRKYSHQAPTDQQKEIDASNSRFLVHISISK